MILCEMTKVLASVRSAHLLDCLRTEKRGCVGEYQLPGSLKNCKRGFCHCFSYNINACNRHFKVSLVEKVELSLKLHCGKHQEP